SNGVWRAWPEGPRSGLLSKEHVDESERRLFLYAQWQLARQLDHLAQIGRRGGCPLYLDLPIGVHDDGFDVWERQALFTSEAALGAPPDAFFDEGQGWGVPPIIPWASRDEGHAYFLACIESHASRAGALRIDHAAGLHRCYWVPRGLSPRDGVYVRQ